MAKLKKPVELETAFNSYTLTELLGEGGAGRVYGGVDGTGQAIAVKVLTQQSRDKRQRFKNEIGFLAKTSHPHIVRVLDHGVATADAVSGPFYVMPRYTMSLRAKIGTLSPAEALSTFSGILDGVEAAHLLGATHRDLKPENVLIGAGGPAVADFGVARFTEDQLHTLVETAPMQRLANFQYAAPEQRTPGRQVDLRADIYALGLILNELFTAQVPHGTDYRAISSASEQHGYLDKVVAMMIRQAPGDRPASIGAVKHEVQKFAAEAVTLQKLRELDKTVVPEGEVTDPLAHRPPQIVGVEWSNGRLTMTLDQPISRDWNSALLNMGSYSSPMGHGPETLQFNGNKAISNVDENTAQSVINAFKDWAPKATARLKYQLEAAAQKERADRIAQLRGQRAAEERRLRVNSALKF